VKRTQIEKMPGLSGFKLSHIVSKLVFVKPNERAQVRQDKTKKAVLRALCDRYPNVWPGINDIAKSTSCSPAQVRRVLRELEYKDRLIVDINSRLTWQRRDGRPGLQLESDDAGKKGGRGKNCTPQYFINDRKIYDIYYQQKAQELADKQSKTHSSEDEKANHARNETQSSENQNPRIPASEPSQNPITVIVEPIMSCNREKATDQLGTSHVKPTSEQPVTQEKEAAKKQEPQRQEKTGSKPSSFSHDMTMTQGEIETVGSRFQGIEHKLSEAPFLDEVVHLISDGEFNIAALNSYDCVGDLTKDCGEAVRQMKNQPFLGRETCADIMGRVMDTLWLRGIKAPKGWLPVLKKLREQGRPATVEAPEPFKPIRARLEPERVLVDVSSALHFYEEPLKPFADLLVETAKYKGVPQSWAEAVPFLDCAIDGNIPHDELGAMIAVRNEIKSRIPQRHAH